MDGFDVVPSVPLVIGGDPRACADAVRPYAALYLGGMGSREKNFYNALAVRMGFAEAAATVQELYLDRRHRDAMAAVPYDFLDQTSLLGDRGRIAERLQKLAASGVTTCSWFRTAARSKRSSDTLKPWPRRRYDVAGVG